MADRNSNPQPLAGRIDALEAAYEYMLAYAAQGTSGTEGGAADEIRRFLERAAEALDGIGEACAAAAGGGAAGGGAADAVARFGAVLGDDAAKAHAAVVRVLAQDAISSELVDNLNASIHLRAVLTDLFLIDEALGLKAAG